MFSDRLKALRERAELTQEGLARKADLASATVAKLEHRGQDPSWSTVLKLAKALGVSVADFVDDAEEPAPDSAPAKKAKGKKK